MTPDLNFNLTDTLISHFDRGLKTLIPGSCRSQRPNPATSEIPDYKQAEKQHISGLMRVNHTGEVCAQALYQGQALTAKLPGVRATMDIAADEEIDHLVWCEQRLNDLNSRPSLLNPVWYALSYAIGAAAGLAGDKVSLGFVAATEQRVCDHLDNHLRQIPEKDYGTREILIAMREDEHRHATQALASGGKDLPESVKNLMTKVSNAMTKTSYYL